ncbi:hypothetical protein D3C77_541180 [compost metagenome]
MAVLNAAARQSHFDTLGRSAVRMITEGVTTIAEVQRTIKDDSVRPVVRRIGDVLIAQGLITFAQANEAAEIQLRYTIEGKVKKFGHALIDLGLVSESDVVTAFGFTEGAVEFLNDLAAARKIQFSALKPVIELWRTERHQESIFDLLIEQGIITKDVLHEEVCCSDDYGYPASHTNICDGARGSTAATV